MIPITRCLGPFVLFLTLMLVGCWDATPAPREEPVPAAVEAERLRATEPPATAEVRELRAQELTAQKAAAQADAVGDQAQADYQRRLGEALGKLRTAAEQREREQRQQINALADEADRRAVAERGEMDRRAVAAQKAADARHDEEARQSDRRWAGVGLALAVAAAVALRLLGLPSLISVGLPAAVGAGCLTLAAWSSVPWLATVLGVVLAGGLVVTLAVLARHLVAEWTDYATRFGAIHPNGKVEADAASRARQPAWVRWMIDHLLARHAGERVLAVVESRSTAGAGAGVSVNADATH